MDRKWTVLSHWMWQEGAQFWRSEKALGELKAEKHHHPFWVFNSQSVKDAKSLGTFGFVANVTSMPGLSFLLLVFCFSCYTCIHFILQAPTQHFECCHVMLVSVWPVITAKLFWRVSTCKPTCIIIIPMRTQYQVYPWNLEWVLAKIGDQDWTAPFLITTPGE